MKKNYLLFFACLVFASITQAQDSTLPRIDRDTLFTTSGFKIIKGQNLKMGVGTMPDGSFKFIGINSNSFFRYTGNTPNSANNANAGQRGISGHEYKVARIEKRGSKKIGFVYYAVLATGLSKYEIDVENAIAAGELAVPKEFKQVTSNTLAAPTQSLADELKKLKDLFDQGALSKEEYDAAKKKLLNQ